LIYLSYILGNIAILIARQRGWPKESAPFKLGSWGMIINVLGLVWASACSSTSCGPAPPATLQ